MLWLYVVTAVYFANEQSLEAAELLPGTNLLELVVKDYVQTRSIQPKDPLKYLTAFEMSSVNTYSNNFEIVSIEFFRSPEVTSFIAHVEASLGIFRYRWGDSALRYLSLALFASEDQILFKKNFNIAYRHPCLQ
jgi:hypothetical protein